MSWNTASEDVLSDAEFIRNNYRGYFDSMSIRKRNKDSVLFDLIPLNDTSRYGFTPFMLRYEVRILSVELSCSGFMIISDTDASQCVVGSKYVEKSIFTFVLSSFESFEQLLSRVMGEKQFSNMLMTLALRRLK
jgi:hypothetical protein